MKLHCRLVIMLFSLVLSGCAVFMAANQPDRKDTDLFITGTHRSMLLAEFGQPTLTQEREGKTYDLFNFVQGYSKGAKVGRAAFHAVADILTIGMWEIVGTPTEAIFNGSKMAYEVRYDEFDRVDRVIVLKAADSAVNPGGLPRVTVSDAQGSVANENQILKLIRKKHC